jgi:hypothetical protein
MGFRKGTYKVLVNGQDVTSRFSPLLLDLSVDRSAGQSADSCEITIANPYGNRVQVPSERASIQIFLNGQWVFEGFVTEVECSIGKGEGRTLSIVGSSVDQGSKAKEPSLKHLDKGTLATAAQTFGQKAGLSVQVAGSIASIERDYWLQQNESFVSWGQRIAREVGGTFKVIGSRAFLTARNEGLSISGRPLTTVDATFGVNLLSASIRPIVTRPRFNKVKISYFDLAKGERVEEEVDTGIEGVDSTLRHLLTAATKDQAQRRAKAHGQEAERDKGQGDVTIVGDARAEPEALCVLSGVMPGADGAYRIHTVSHKLSKKAGFTTTLSLRQPQASGSGANAKLPVGAKAPVPTPRPDPPTTPSGPQ